MTYLIGIFIAACSIFISIVHLRQSVGYYFDPVALAVVLGGTVSVGVMIFPWDHFTVFLGLLWRTLIPRNNQAKILGLECLIFVQNFQGRVPQKTYAIEGLASEILIAGRELLELGLPPDRVENILIERIHSYRERVNKVIFSIRSLAKYPPAFGLIGTILGLVSLMRAISQGDSATESGLKMSIALVASGDGLITANLILNPLGENIHKKLTQDLNDAEIALQAVNLATQNVSLLEAQELLNSYLAKNQRVSVLNQETDQKAGAA